ncbi:MAG: hypothetical protein RML46_12525 [Anaerolineae bacterium]|nr:hypothetical protein [Anaerolineae bacterium]
MEYVNGVLTIYVYMLEQVIPLVGFLLAFVAATIGVYIIRTIISIALG